jgi:hypothetical protein
MEITQPATEPSSSFLIENKWPNNPKEQIAYLDTKNWDLPTKTYILQLLWWNTRQNLKIVPKNETYFIKKKLETDNQITTKQMYEFGQVLRNMNQFLPTITHEKDKNPYPNFTFVLTKIPKDAAPELKKILSNSLSQKQKQMVNARKILETKLSQHDKELQKKEKLTAEDYQQHKTLLEEYYKILLPQDEKLKEKITNAIEKINNKLSGYEELQELLKNKAKEESNKIVKEIKEAEQQRKEQEEQNERKRLAEQQKIEQEKINKAIYEEIELDRLQNLAKLENLKRLEQQNQEQERLERLRLRQEEINKQWIPWITNGFNRVQQNITDFMSTITSTITSWWLWLTGR